MIICQHEQGSQEWLQDRAGIITSSEFKKVLAKGRGKSPSKVRLDYMLVKANEILTGLPVEEGFNSIWMQNGTEREPDARSLYELLTGNEVEEVGLILDDRKRIGTSVDGLVGKNVTLEIKCPKLATHLGYVLHGTCPTEYYAQVQGQMFITGRQFCHFVSYHPEAYEPILIVTVERDDKYIETMKDQLDLFLTEMDHMVAKFQDQKEAA